MGFLPICKSNFFSSVIFVIFSAVCPSINHSMIMTTICCCLYLSQIRLLNILSKTMCACRSITFLVMHFTSNLISSLHYFTEHQSTKHKDESSSNGTGAKLQGVIDFHLFVKLLMHLLLTRVPLSHHPTCATINTSVFWEICLLASHVCAFITELESGGG